MKRTGIRITTTAVGVLVALAVIASQLFYFPQQSSDKHETKTEQSQSEESEDHIYFSAQTSTAPSSVHVELNPNVVFLFEIIFEEKDVALYTLDIPRPLSQCFRTLFGLAISPNAP